MIVNITAVSRQNPYALQARNPPADVRIRPTCRILVHELNRLNQPYGEDYRIAHDR